MEQLIIHEQDLANAVCLLVAEERQITPEQVEVELVYDDEEKEPFFAEAYVNGVMSTIPMVEVITAIRLWIDRYLQQDALAAGIDLQFDENEGIYAVVR